MSDNEIVCKECDDGTRFNQLSKTCEVNTCKCFHGIPAHGDSCALTGATNCTSCDPGYHLEPSAGDIFTCQENLCNCLNGISGTGLDCPIHNQEWCLDCATNFAMNYDGNNVTCQNCPPGEHFDSSAGSCKQNQCSCYNGEAKFGEVCEESGGHNCESCDQGYHLNKVGEKSNSTEIHVCSPNQCHCKDGFPATGRACSMNGQSKCESCTTDFYLKINSEESICQPCEKGYHRNENTDVSRCRANECHCNYGIGKVKSLCQINQSHDCFDCDYGYHLVETGSGMTTCKPNECSCNSGSSGTGVDCPTVRS